MPNSQTQTQSTAQAGPAEPQRSWRDQAAAYVQDGGRAIGQGYEHASHTLGQHPLTSVLTAFGLGVGAGLLIAAALAEPPRPRRWYDFQFDTGKVEQFGRRMLDAIADVLPESVGKRLHS